MSGETTGVLPRAPLAAICLGYFLVILDSTAVTVALPRLGAEFGSGVATLQWVVAGYTLCFAAFLLSSGTIGDRFGPRRVFLCGLVVFTLASVGCGLAPTAPTLVALRMVQGVGAAVLLPSSLALLHHEYSAPAARARAIGFWGGVSGVAAVAGPVLGGVLVSGPGWRWVFFINLPVGALALLMSLRTVRPVPGHHRSIDVPGQVLAVAGLGALTTTLIESGVLGWTHPLVLGGFAVFAFAAVAFVAVERRAGDPMLPADLFRARTFVTANVVGLLINFGFYGQLFLVTLYFQQLRGLSAVQTGFALLPEAGLVSVAAVLAGRAAGRVGARPVMITGLLIGGFGLLSWLAAGRDTPYPVLLLPLLACGFGMSFTMTATTAAAMNAAAAGRGGAASGALNTARQIGGALGVALLGTFVGDRLGFVAGLHRALIVAGAAFFAGATITVARWSVRTRKQPR